MALRMQIALTGIRAWQSLFHPGQDYFLLPGDSEGKKVAATFILHLRGDYSQKCYLESKGGKSFDVANNWFHFLLNANFRWFWTGRRAAGQNRAMSV